MNYRKLSTLVGPHHGHILRLDPVGTYCPFLQIPLAFGYREGNLTGQTSSKNC